LLEVWYLQLKIIAEACGTEAQTRHLRFSLRDFRVLDFRVLDFRVRDFQVLDFQVLDF
jgi:hypothetical protein